jgi:hypothetical protein
MHISGISDMGSFQFTVQYDPDKLALADVTDWYAGIDDVVMGSPAPGLITFVWAASANGISISDGVLCNLKFTALTSGESALSFTSNPTLVEFTDFNGNVFEPVLKNTNAGATASGEYLLSVYPNPGKGIFNIRLENDLQGQVNIKVVNSLGSIVFEEKSVAMDKLLQKTLNLGGLPNGIYILSVEGGQQIIQKKIILEK